MNCSHCGFPLEDGAKFCNNCGAKVIPSDAPAGAPLNPSGPAASAVPPSQPVPPQGAYHVPQQLPVSESPVWKALRRALSSPEFLLAAAVMTVYLVLTFISQISVPAAPCTSQSRHLLTSVAGVLPLLLLTCGLWLMRFSSRGNGPLRGTGLVRGVSIFMIVIVAIVLAIFAIALIPFMAAWASGKVIFDSADLSALYALFDGSHVLAFIVFGLAAFMLILVLIYFAKTAGMARTIREIDETGMQRRAIPSFLNFVHVCLLLLNVVGIISILTSGRLKAYLAQQNFPVQLNILNVLSWILGILLPLSLYLAISKLKKELRSAG